MEQSRGGGERCPSLKYYEIKEGGGGALSLDGPFRYENAWGPTLPCSSLARTSATLELPVNCVTRGRADMSNLRRKSEGVYNGSGGGKTYKTL